MIEIYEDMKDVYVIVFDIKEQGTEVPVPSVPLCIF